MIEISFFDEKMAVDWDKFCDSCVISTFLHTRKFLSYHGSKFRDRSFVIKKKNKLIGLFPAAESQGNNSIIVSHPGITYGGLLHSGDLRGEETIEVFQKIKIEYAKLKYKELIYKAVPKIYHQSPSDDDLYALFRQGASHSRVDLSCAINLNNRMPISKRRARCLVKAEESGAYISQGINLFEGMWQVLEENLLKKHKTKPVHNLDEILKLAKLFPEEIQCTCAMLKNQIIAGVVTFHSKICTHAQYSSSSDVGNNCSALDLVFNFLINEAIKNKKYWFDFGISTENEGRSLNSGLYNFKSEFGGGGLTYESYTIKI